MKTILPLSIVSCLAALQLGACAYTDPSESGASGPAGETAPVDEPTGRTIATIPIGEEGTVTFTATATDEGPMVSIQEVQPAYAKKTPMDEIMAAAPTSLEAFMALAPDQEPPEPLVAAHPAEAASLGREDTTVRQIDVDVNAPIEKSLASCQAWVFAYSPSFCEALNFFWDTPRAAIVNSTIGNYYVGGNANYYSPHRIGMGACNESAYDMTAKYYYDAQGGASTWTYDAATYLGPNRWGRYWHFKGNTPWYRWMVQGTASVKHIFYLTTNECGQTM